MRYLLTVFTSLLFFAASFAQAYDKTLGTVSVQGYSKLLVNADNYIAHIFIQEEEQKVGYTTIGKLSIDSVKINFFSNLKKFGIEEKDSKMMGISTQEIGQYPNFLANISYEVKLKNKDIANRLINEMRFVGLKGLIIKRVLTITQKDNLADSLYYDAINDAKRIAAVLAQKANKVVGEIRSIEIMTNSATSFGMETNADNYNTFGYRRFEMDYRDKYATCYVRVVFEMK